MIISNRMMGLRRAFLNGKRIHNSNKEKRSWIEYVYAISLQGNIVKNEITSWCIRRSVLIIVIF